VFSITTTSIESEIPFRVGSKQTYPRIKKKTYPRVIFFIERPATYPQGQSNSNKKKQSKFLTHCDFEVEKNEYLHTEFHFKCSSNIDAKNLNL
jgi:hypothetical protein